MFVGVVGSFILVWVLKEFCKLQIECSMDKAAFVSGVVLLICFIYKMWFGKWDVIDVINEQ